MGSMEKAYDRVNMKKLGFWSVYPLLFNLYYLELGMNVAQYKQGF